MYWNTGGNLSPLARLPLDSVEHYVQGGPTREIATDHRECKLQVEAEERAAEHMMRTVTVIYWSPVVPTTACHRVLSCRKPLLTPYLK